jgi:hypothetical protein
MSQHLASDQCSTHSAVPPRRQIIVIPCDGNDLTPDAARCVNGVSVPGAPQIVGQLWDPLRIPRTKMPSDIPPLGPRTDSISVSTTYDLRPTTAYSSSAPVNGTNRPRGGIPASSSRIPTEAGMSKRLAPAPPGFITVTTTSTSSSLGMCVCP